MSKILVFANTHYQLILAIQMKFTIFSKDYVCLALSDHSNNTEPIYQRLKEYNFFDECIFVKSKGYIHNRTFSDKLFEFFQIVGAKSNRYKCYLDGLSDYYFDEVIFYNLEIDTYGIYSILSEYNKELKYSSYEEGVLSYNNFYYDTMKFKIIRFIRKLLNKPTIFDKYDRFYCVYPELYTGKLKTIVIPKISFENEELKKLLSKIFNLNKTIDYKKYKYIYFESIYDTEGRSIGEHKFFFDFIEKVGKDNVLVKKHPRSTIYIYEENGIAVDANSSAPFEAIQLNNDMSNCVFVAATSGSVLSVNSIIDKPSQVYMFYPMTEYKNIDSLNGFVKNLEKVVEKFHAEGKLKHVEIIQTLDDIGIE